MMILKSRLKKPKRKCRALKSNLRKKKPMLFATSAAEIWLSRSADSANSLLARVIPSVRIQNRLFSKQRRNAPIAAVMLSKRKQSAEHHSTAARIIPTATLWHGIFRQTKFARSAANHCSKRKATFFTALI